MKVKDLKKFTAFALIASLSLGTAAVPSAAAAPEENGGVSHT